MKPPHPTKGYSNKVQIRITESLVKQLLSMGFERFQITALEKRLNVASPYSIIVKPPKSDESSWQFLFWNRNKHSFSPWIGGDGTMSFSSKWATPSSVLAAILQHTLNAGYRMGVDDIRSGIKDVTKQFSKKLDAL